MKTVVIDPGHGGYEYGAVNGNRFEKADNLRLGLAVRDRLAAQQGVNVIMTRDSDTLVPLSERANISNRNNADLFISLHRNAHTNTSANGVENFVANNASQVSFQNAINVLNEVVDVGVQNNRGLKTDNFYVLVRTNAPAQLLEMGFISNEVDNNYFDRYLNEYATAIARGIMRSLGLNYVEPSQPDNRATTIRSIQSNLNNLYGTNISVDGLYGPQTRNALTKGLQIELNNQYGANLTVDGIFGSQTRAQVRSVRRGSIGNIVYILQAALFANGYNVGELDGIFGRQTEDALIRYQSDKGLTPDGIAGPATFNALLSSV